MGFGALNPKTPCLAVVGGSDGVEVRWSDACRGTWEAAFSGALETLKPQPAANPKAGPQIERPGPKTENSESDS